MNAERTDNPSDAADNGDQIRHCRYCHQPIRVEASVCHHCSRHQNWFVQYLGQLGIAASIILVVIALFQLLEAREERIVASEAADVAREAKALNDFTMTVIRAENDDRDALDSLRSWANSTRFPFAEQAANVFANVIGDYGGPIEPGYATVSWPKGTDPKALTIDQLRELYQSSRPVYHTYLVVFVWKRTDIPKRDRMTFLIDVLKSDSSNRAVYYAGKFLSEEAGLEWRPFHVDPLLGWWDESMKRTGQ